MRTDAPANLKKRLQNGETSFSYRFESFGTTFSRNAIEETFTKAFALWATEPTPLAFTRIERNQGKVPTNIVITVLKTHDPLSRVIFGPAAKDAVIASRDEKNQVAIYIRDKSPALGSNWNADALFQAVEREIGRLLGSEDSEAPAAAEPPPAADAIPPVPAADAGADQALPEGVLVRAVLNLHAGDSIDHLCFVAKAHLADSSDAFRDSGAGGSQVVLVKGAQTRSGQVEVHSLSLRGQQADYALRAATSIPVADAVNFEFLLGREGDLVCIKTAYCASGYVEVHRYTAASDYRLAETRKTSIPQGQGQNYQYRIADNGELFCIKTAQSDSGHVEVHRYTADSGDYQTAQIAMTPLQLLEGPYFSFLLAPNRDLYCIKTAYTGTGTVEVHAFTADSGYKLHSVATGTPLALPEGPSAYGLVGDSKLLSIAKNEAGASNDQWLIQVVQYL